MLVLELSRVKARVFSGYTANKTGWLPKRMSWMQPLAAKSLTEMGEACGHRMEFTDVYRLGRSATRFSPDSAVEFADFQKQFAHYRADFEKVLSIAGWDGNVDALFAAVRDAKENDGAVRFINGEPGTVVTRLR